MQVVNYGRYGSLPTVPSSSVSLESSESAISEATSSISIYTSGSARTIPGPGALTGKAILAFGKLTLRGIENVVISRRLQNIISVFPQRKDSVIPHVESTYDDLLELSRPWPGLYSRRIRRQALGIIMIQIALEVTADLVRSLVKWPLSEITEFLHELILCMPPQWTGVESGRQDIHCELLEVYLAHEPTNSVQRKVVSFVRFMGQVAAVSDSTCLAVVNAGFLDMLLYICIGGFQPGVIAPESSSDLCSDTYNYALSVIFAHPSGRQILSIHPVHSLWPRSLRFSFGTLVVNQVSHRRKAWQCLDSKLVEQRLLEIKRGLFFIGNNESTRTSTDNPPIRLVSSEDLSLDTGVVDLFVDLLEFSNSENYGVQVKAQATVLLSRFIGTIDESLCETLTTEQPLESLYDGLLRDVFEIQDPIEELHAYLDREEESAPRSLIDVMIQKFTTSSWQRSEDDSAGGMGTLRGSFAGTLLVVLSTVRDRAPEPLMAQPVAMEEVHPYLLYGSLLPPPLLHPSHLAEVSSSSSLGMDSRIRTSRTSSDSVKRFSNKQLDSDYVRQRELQKRYRAAARRQREQARAVIQKRNWMLQSIPDGDPRWGRDDLPG